MIRIWWRFYKLVQLILMEHLWPILLLSRYQVVAKWAVFDCVFALWPWSYCTPDLSSDIGLDQLWPTPACLHICVTGVHMQQPPDQGPSQCHHPATIYFFFSLCCIGFYLLIYRHFQIQMLHSTIGSAHEKEISSFSTSDQWQWCRAVLKVRAGDPQGLLRRFQGGFHYNSIHK